jgi:integrase/recombinase XerD
MSPLRKQMLDDMVVRGMAKRTQESYLSAVQGLAKHYRRSPAEVSGEEAQGYLLHLLRERGLSHSTCNLVTNGLRFFYRVTRKRPDTELCLPRRRVPQKLPELLSREELARLFEVPRNLKHRALLLTTYAAGLRVSEATALEIGDIDSARMTLRIEQGKGGKDRYTLLSRRLLGELRRYWLAHRPGLYLFPGREPQYRMSVSTAQRIYTRAKERAGITKRCGIHGLRHAFATHLLEAGVALPVLQRLMGHGHIGTTMRYLHLAQPHLTERAAPLDLLELPGQAHF